MNLGRLRAAMHPVHGDHGDYDALLSTSPYYSSSAAAALPRKSSGDRTCSGRSA
jgi:hypothetical protein